MDLKSALKFLFLIALIISVFWYISNPGYEPLLAAVVSLSALLSNLYFGRKKSHDKGQNQTVGDNSSAIQAGGDVNISPPSNSDEDGE